MASLRKLKNKRYLAEVRKQGQYKSKTCDSKVQAMAWIADIEPQLSQDGVVQGKTLGDTLTRYRDEISPSKKSHKNEHNRLNKFLRSPLTGILLIELKQHHFDEWIQSSLTKIKPSSVNRLRADYEKLQAELIEIAKLQVKKDEKNAKGYDKAQ